MNRRRVLMVAAILSGASALAYWPIVRTAFPVTAVYAYLHAARPSDKIADPWGSLLVERQVWPAPRGESFYSFGPDGIDDRARGDDIEIPFRIGAALHVPTEVAFALATWRALVSLSALSLLSLGLVTLRGWHWRMVAGVHVVTAAGTAAWFVSPFFDVFRWELERAALPFPTDQRTVLATAGVGGALWSVGLLRWWFRSDEGPDIDPV